MARSRWFTKEKPIPEGFQIFEERLSVAGVKHRLDSAQAFAKGGNVWLECEADPSNTHDQNAIKVIGCNKGWLGTRRRFIGFVPKGAAAKIADSPFSLSDLRPRLLHTYLGDTGAVEVLFQVLGPKGKKEDYPS